MKKNAIVFTANTMHVAQANLMIESLFDKEKGNFDGDLWVISTHLSKRCQDFLDSRGIRYLINPLMNWQEWPYRKEIARSQPEFMDGRLNEHDAFMLYRNKRMSKLIICDWVEKFGDNYEAVALCDNDLYFQRDVNELFQKTAAVDSEVVWYWQEENKNLPGTNLWTKNFHYTRLHDVDGMDFGEHEINIGFVISSPKLMRDIFRRVGAFFYSLNIELFRDCKWHDQDLVRVIRAQDPHLFRLFDEGDILHLCNGGENLLEEQSPQEFYHKKTCEKPYIVHFAGGAWKKYPSIAASYKVESGVFFFVNEESEAFDVVRSRTDYDPFDALSPYYTKHNAQTKQLSRAAWNDVQKGKLEGSHKKNMLFFSWLNTGSHRPVREMLEEFLSGDAFDLAIIDGNVNAIDHDGLTIEDLPDLLAHVTRTVRDNAFGRAFGYKRSDIPEEAVEGAIAALVKEYGCSKRNARAVANAAYIYLSKAVAFYQPDVVLCWGTYLLSSRILKSICKMKGIPFLTMELGVLPDTLAFDCMGHMGESWVAQHSSAFNALSLDEADTDNARKYLNKMRKERPSRNVKLQVSTDSTNQMEQLKANNKKTIVYVGSNCAFSGHVPYDDKARTFHSPYFEDNDDVVRHLSETFSGDEDIQVIYKPHPISITRGLDLKDDYPNVTVLRDINLDDCLNIADLAIVKVSQGNYEALLRDVPVLMIGQNQLNGSGAVYELDKKINLKTQVEKALENGFTDAQKAAFETHVARLLKYYLYSVGQMNLAQPQSRLMSTIAELLADTGAAYLLEEQEALNAHKMPAVQQGETPAVSIIMPVYNGEDYLVDCIGSLLSQTRGDFELLCVNNGSTDNSQGILDYFAKLDPRVKPLWQEEPNQRSARNLGVQHAVGKYLHFFDCDDLFISTAYEEIIPYLEETNADVLYFFFNELYNTIKTGSPRHFGFEPYLPREDVFRMEEDHKSLFAQYPFPWAKIFRADFFRENDLYFDLDCENFDDNPQNLRTLMASSNIFVLKKPFYKFRINEKSMTQSINRRVYGMIDAIRIMNEVYTNAGRYQEFQESFVPYKIHLLHFAWERLPQEMKRDFYAEIPKLFLPNDETFFLNDRLASKYPYITKEKVVFVQSALKGSWPPVVPQIQNSDIRMKTPYPTMLEERYIKKISAYLARTSPELFRFGKKAYRTIRPLRNH